VPSDKENHLFFVEHVMGLHFEPSLAAGGARRR
jgi:hypothetical protein